MKGTRLQRYSAFLLAIFLSGCGRGGEECTPNDRTICREGVSYWLDSCGTETAEAETCECGCNADSTGCEEACACVPDCSIFECGPDPVCQTSCGDCPIEEVCNHGTCVIPCDEGATRCAGEVIEGCHDNEWSAGVNCSRDYQVCVDGACVYSCTDGERRCDGTTIITCDANRWVPGVNCAASAQVCADAACVTPCPNGESRCTGGIIETCVSNNWVAGVRCAHYGQVCVAGACEDPCSDGEIRCAGDTIETCVVNSWVAGVDCAQNGQVCVAGGCVIPCSDGENRCDDDVIETCNANSWIAGLDCSEDWQVCLDGACVTDCIDDQTRCGGNVIFTCSNDNWLPGLDCFDGGLFCMNGACSEPTPCLSANDCPTDAPCTVGVNDELTDLFGECATYGALAPGSECNDLDDPAELPFAERCSALYCFGGMCTEVCQIDNNCPSGMSCEVLQLSNVDDTIMVCMADPGCGAPADCEEGESCWPALDGNQLRGWCTANGGIDPVGTNCDQYADTCEVFCLEPLCTEWCTFDEDCPDGMSCEIVYFCLVEPCSDPNNMAQASMCLQDPTGAR